MSRALDAGVKPPAEATSGELRVIVSAGGSGGHVFPAQSFAEALEKADSRVRVTFATGERYSTGRDLFDGWPAGRVIRIKSAAYRGARSAVSPRFYGSLAAGFVDSRRAIARHSPALVVGFGGHHTVPIVLAARAARVPVILHEQNAVFGLANKFLARFATRVGCAFEEACRTPRDFHAGMPLRSALARVDRAAALAMWGLDPAKKTLLVSGGSQGARGVNDRVLQFAAQYAEEIKKTWQIVHLAGSADFERVNAFYAGSPIASKRFAFCENMSNAYSAADVVLSRAGAVTLHELAFFEKCAILVPYPAANGHQLENARALERRGAAFVVEQKNLDARRIRAILSEVAGNPSVAAGVAKACAQTLRPGSDALVEESLRAAAAKANGA